jgi:hypothetical protein
MRKDDFRWLFTALEERQALTLELLDSLCDLHECLLQGVSLQRIGSLTERAWESIITKSSDGCRELLTAMETRNIDLFICRAQQQGAHILR